MTTFLCSRSPLVSSTNMMSDKKMKKMNFEEKKKKKNGIDTDIGVSKRKRSQTQTQTQPQTQPQAEEGMRLRDIEDSFPSFTKEEAFKLRVNLLNWYGHNHRELPWRNTFKFNTLHRQQQAEKEQEEELQKRAYGVWVSEVMLQQTQVQTVIPYYNRWMLKWPTIHHLSRASLEEVNEMWAGLGYYRRARFLLEGAKQVVAEGGKIPKMASNLRKIPGIGDYTAGAIASIAFNEVVPVVDGNVVRVIARLKAVSTNPKNSVTVKKFWKLAAEVVDPIRPGDFNQALMELGATLCTPLNPSCSSCPSSEICQALSISKRDSSVAVTDYPIKVVKAKQRCDFSAVCVVELLGSDTMLDQNQLTSKFILVKRPDEGLLAGLWEFPSVPLDGETVKSARREAVNQFLKNVFKIDAEKTCNIVLREDVGEFVHIFTHIRLKLYVELLVLQLKGGADDLLKGQHNETTTWKCVDSNSLSSMGLTSSVRKVYSMVQKFKQKSVPSKHVPAKKRNRTTKRN